MSDFHLESEHVAELALQRLDVGAGALDLEPALALATGLAEAGELFDLAHRQAALDDVAGESLGVARSDQGPGMAHAELAGLDQLPDALR